MEVFLILYYGPLLHSLKIAPSHGGSGLPSNTWFLELTRIHNPNGIMIGSTIFAGLNDHDRQTTLLHL